MKLTYTRIDSHTNYTDVVVVVSADTLVDYFRSYPEQLRVAVYREIHDLFETFRRNEQVWDRVKEIGKWFEKCLFLVFSYSNTVNPPSQVYREYLEMIKLLYPVLNDILSAVIVSNYPWDSHTADVIATIHLMILNSALAKTKEDIIEILK